jgi:hypothetical protein
VSKNKRAIVLILRYLEKRSNRIFWDLNIVGPPSGLYGRGYSALASGNVLEVGTECPIRLVILHLVIPEDLEAIAASW